MTDGQAHKNFIVSLLLLLFAPPIFCLCFVSDSLLLLLVLTGCGWESVGKSENCSTGWPVGVSSCRPRQEGTQSIPSLLGTLRPTASLLCCFVLNCRLAELWNVADSVNFPFVPTAHGLFVIRESKHKMMIMRMMMMISSRVFELVEIAFCVSGIRFGVLFTAFHSFCCQY